MEVGPEATVCIRTSWLPTCSTLLPCGPTPRHVFQRTAGRCRWLPAVELSTKVCVHFQQVSFPKPIAEAKDYSAPMGQTQNTHTRLPTPQLTSVDRKRAVIS